MSFDPLPPTSVEVTDGATPTQGHVVSSWGKAGIPPLARAVAPPRPLSAASAVWGRMHGGAHTDARRDNSVKGLRRDWEPLVVCWDRSKVQQWVLLAVGVPEVEARKVTLDGAALLAFPSDHTTELENALKSCGLLDGSAQVIAGAYGAQQWLIETEVGGLRPAPYYIISLNVLFLVVRVAQTRLCASGKWSKFSTGQLM